MHQEYNPRATVIESRTQDEAMIQQILTQMQKSQNLDLSYVLSKFIEMPALKQQPSFMQTLFSHNLSIIHELLSWMFTPSHFIHAYQLKGNFKPFPIRCKEFAKDNWCFYEQLYLSILNNTISFTELLNFLKEQYLDPETLPTSLGYFQEVMIPFVKYQFSSSYQIVQYVTAQRKDIEDKTFGIMLILPEQTLSQIISLSYHTSIYKFIHTAILVSLQDSSEMQTAMVALQKLFLFAKRQRLLSQTFQEEINIKYVRFAENMCEFLQNLVNSLKETVQNIQENVSDRLKAYISVFTKVNLIQYFVNTIIESSYCRDPEYQKISNYSELQEDIIEFALKILMYSVSIYDKICSVEEIKQYLYPQIQYLFDNLDLLSNLVIHPQNKSIPISSGQNIKPITFMKYAFFQLFLNCLTFHQSNEKQINLNLDRIPVLPMIERYLIQNRWNNIVHHTLEKICEIVATKNLNILMSKNRKEITDGFLGMLIENFTNKNYIFLNTFNFTPQGNLHSLYVIAKKLAYLLKNSHQLVAMIHESEPWKKFIMTDLKKYEDKVYGPVIKPNQYDERRSTQSFESLQVDEFDSIKKLIDNISVTKKWPVRDSFKRKNSSSAIFRKSGDVYTFSSGEEMHRSFSGHYSHKKRNNQNGENLQTQTRKKTVELNRDDIKKNESFEIDEFELVMMEKPERQKPKLAKSDILKSTSPQKQEKGERNREKTNHY